MTDFQKKYLKIFIFFILLLTVYSCKTVSPESKVLTISRGTSFGHCRGICNKEITVGPAEVVYSQWANGENPGTVKVVRVLPKEKYESLLKDLDRQSFAELKETIGCPDCADGGAEWLEVTAGNKKKRVTFEYGKSPEKLKNIIIQLKKIQETFEK
ncbi:hypothetical protein ACSBL2_08200 [Pedobacter sp. AW31-3R]|uniref:hypothetical protein n=1 Tax=Pedobacter sp. AW31-3R TaxID=3445781 RepID=UPI003F9FE739